MRIALFLNSSGALRYESRSRIGELKAVTTRVLQSNVKAKSAST